MEWLKKHSDTLAVLAVVVGAAIWMNNGLHQLKHDITSEMNVRFSSLEKDVAIIKTVLVMKEVMPKELACNEEKK